MLKTIKFNLTVDGGPVRTLEELREHFNIHDVLGYYHSGLLLKWLTVRGYSSEADQVTALKTDTEPELIRQLIRVVGGGTAGKETDYAVHVLEYEAQRQRDLAHLERMKFQELKVVHKYHEGYAALLATMRERGQDDAFVKQSVSQLCSEYIGLFILDRRRFYMEFIEAAPLVVFRVLMHSQLRDHFLEHSAIQAELQKVYRDERILEAVGPHIKSWNGETAEYWKDLVPATTHCMILSMEDRNLVRDVGANDVEWKASDVNGKYLILRGIDYKSKYPDDLLLWMEV